MDKKRTLNIVWFPTFKCNLKCSYCAARNFPDIYHGTELLPETWVCIFNCCPWNIQRVSISGREPTMYNGLKCVLENTNFQITIDTNLRIHPSKWLSSSVAERVIAINCNLHFHPEHSQAISFWQHILWLKENIPNASHKITCIEMRLWRDLPLQRKIVEQKCEELGIKHKAITFCEDFLWKYRIPLHSGIASMCTGGYDYGVILPDGAVYRCIGHAYYREQIVGNIIVNGWNIWHNSPRECTKVLCTVCDFPASRQITMKQNSDNNN